jgi:hypothetical protein
MLHLRHAFALLVLVGCSDWRQVKNARDIEGQLVRVESHGKESTIDEVVLCDTSGFVIAGDSRDCADPSAPKFDTRHDKVLEHFRDSKAAVGLVVTGILTGVLVPAAIVGTKVLGK